MIEDSSRVIQVQISQIRPNPKQPRKVFKNEDLEDLARSVAKEGLLQPLLVTRQQEAASEGFVLLMGERRLRAARAAGLQTVPCIVKQVGAADYLRLALVENIQRADLNVVEEAQAYEELLREFNLSQDEVARMVGKDRSTISNVLRILNLPTAVQNDLLAGILTSGHAKALLSLDDHRKMLQVRDLVVAKKLSVRQTEAICRKAARQVGDESTDLQEMDPNMEYLARRLRSHLQTKVRFCGGGEKGRIEISYFSAEDLDRILQKLSI